MDAADAGTRPRFGTDGLRGVANVEPITCETALRLGRALVHLGRRDSATRVQIVIGKDTRVSSDMLESALAAGICSMGGDALLGGTLPTPAVAHVTRSVTASAGIVVSASHNPFQDNGLKVFDHTGFKLPDGEEAKIERLLVPSAPDLPSPRTGALGRAVRLEDAEARYIRSITELFARAPGLKGVKVAIDCAHGAAYRVAPAAVALLGAHVEAIGVDPNGENINRDVGAMYPQRLRETVRATGAHIGIALDGDGDRAILVDEQGQVVDGDEVLALIATDMLARGILKQATVVATVMSNLGLELALRDRGAHLVRTRVGDRYVVEEMRRHDYNLGGEQSGHLILLDHSTTGDGLMAGLTVARLMVDSGRPLSTLKRVMTKFPQVLLNVRVESRRDLEAVEPIRALIAKIRGELNERGRVLVRYSGTEPLVRVMVEGEDVDTVKAYAEEIAAAVRAHLA